jgi:hypothetical protein
MRSLVPLLMLSLLAGSGLLGQESVIESRLDAATHAALRPILAAAGRDSLPVRALEAKALEGAAKRRPSVQIVMAVERLAAELRAARAVLRDAAPGAPIPDGEIVAAAETIRRGVSGEEVGTLKRTAPPATSLEIPFALLAELVQRGIPADEARSVLEHLIRTGVPQERMIEIPLRVDVALRVGAPPIAALGSALQGLGIPAPPIPPQRPRPGRPPATNP